ncbi:50S ribosomal protein L18 [bacterium]|nr:50S ribosomal protein L18 [bacterium]
MSKKEKNKKEKRYRRHKRIRAKINGTSDIPRLCVFRSNNHIYAQLIDDQKGVVISAASDKEIKKDKGSKKGKTELAFETGKLIAQKAKKRKIERIVFDRAGYKYHGRVKALAEGARKGGLRF